MSLFLIFRKLKHYPNIYILYVMNEKRIVIKKLGQISFIYTNIRICLFSINMLELLKLFHVGIFCSENFFKILSFYVNQKL